MSEPIAHPTNALEIAEQVRSGERSAVDVVDEHLARIDADDGDVQAFNLVTAELAREQAAAVDAKVASGEEVGPLAGVPIVLKDNMCTAGIATTCSSKILEGWQPPYDADAVERVRDAGAVLVGKANMDEFAMGSSTENSAFRTTRNPLDLDKVPGGSSGGSAAAVAAGFAPLSLGSDTGGSIRQPAAFCGLVGVKPTYGVVSRNGLIAFGSSLDQIGPFSRTVAESAQLLDVLSGHDRRDSTSIDQPSLDLSSVLDRGVDGLKVGIVRELSGGEGSVEGISADVVAQTQAAAAALEAAGATICEVSVPSATLGLSAYYLVAPAEASSNLSRFDGVRFGLRVDAPTTGEMMTATRTAGFGPEVKRRIMLGTYALSAGYYDAFYGKALKVRTMMLNEFAAVYDQVDLLLTPTAPTTAFPIGDRTADPMAMYVNDVCTIPSNLVGHPAISVPFGDGDDGLPVGVQLLGPALSEPTMYAAAAALEAAAPPLAAFANQGGVS